MNTIKLLTINNFCHYAILSPIIEPSLKPIAKIKGNKKMRVRCPHCGSKAIITSTNEQSDRVKDLYCSCTNTAECGATFVATLAFKNNLNPPIKNTMEMAKNLVDLMEEKQKSQKQAAFGFD